MEPLASKHGHQGREAVRHCTPASHQNTRKKTAKETGRDVHSGNNKTFRYKTNAEEKTNNKN
jgi:hypothetical protein